MTISFDTATCRNFDRSIGLEWLCTNGLGGYASGTVVGANTRKYHGYLVVAANPPVNRFVVLSRVEDRLIVGAGNGSAGGAAPGAGTMVYDLSTNEFADIIHPQGYKYLRSFELNHGPVWRYQIGEVVIQKSITLVPGQDTVIIKYEIISAPADTAPLRLQVQPMLAGRDFHATIQLHQRPWWTFSMETDSSIALHAPECPVKLFLTHNAAKFSVNACWWYNFTFRVERTLGYLDREDLWTPGVLEFVLEPGKPVGLIASTRSIPWSKHGELIAQAAAHHEQLATAFTKQRPADDFLATLSVAADQFIVRRGPAAAVAGGLEKKSVIAGYPWFEDWGRDTFIALPGLTLVTGKFDIAKSILTTFADHMQRGLLPNRFPDKAYKPDYNTVDASMWFIHAAYQYWRYSGDGAFLSKYLYPKLVEIIECYSKGTDYGIRADVDGLIRQGEPGHNLTWMDAKIGDWVVTPRQGKPVEINGLWYSNLRIMALVARHAGDTARAAVFTTMADRVAGVFQKTFWNERTQCLHDVIGDDGRGDGLIRPNQCVAVSVPFSPLDETTQQKLIATVQKFLVTPIGLRTLAPGNPGYHGRCAGDQRARDMAYHQGTVWPWLMGPFITAYVRVHGGDAAARKQAAAFLEPLKAHLREAGLGSISEIADAEPPFTPRGCPAQAWSVGEALRAYWEDVLAQAPAWPHETPPSATALPRGAVAQV